MPENGADLTPQSELMTKEELFKLLNIFISCGVDKIRLTGGEPTVSKDCESVIREIGSYPAVKDICITTNGVVLKNKLAKYKEAGLTHINISLDTMVEAKFQFISRRQGVKNILENVDRALGMGFQQVKLNCVVVKGINDDEILDFVNLTKDRKLDVRFIEFMPFLDNKWNKSKMVSSKEIIQSIRTKHSLIKLPNPPSQPSNDYKVEGFKGKVGFISSMTDKFCASCNRIRITADGNLKVCLFGREETNLIKLIRENRSEEEILEVISAAIKRKKAAHDGMFEIAKDLKNRPMVKIGG
eukprot:CAMPEP_0170525518 /NCGR_PEP_ID=MMETSP0209-20121228/10974_1 /TAXON_ID=665100 ORGANISM="Litonotus pictus, Strain P1" /NCGR_SAMPLE_ID=MMETSP0209 /ASSEMBLY_ACC=CAM_ASM_000301 /LENGTH=298 /DNA_ID=CAMNT_0010814801 /DNA_START=355 /DNA_END=1251 /DNA_ORIENTATION=+